MTGFLHAIPLRRLDRGPRYSRNLASIWQSYGRTDRSLMETSAGTENKFEGHHDRYGAAHATEQKCRNKTRPREVSVVMKQIVLSNQSYHAPLSSVCLSLRTKYR